MPLRPEPTNLAMSLAQPSAARTRWQISTRPGVSGSASDLGAPAWRVELTKAVGGQPGSWDLAWCDGTSRLSVPDAGHALPRLTDQALALK